MLGVRIKEGGGGVVSDGSKGVSFCEIRIGFNGHLINRRLNMA
jgi:hypothetical protein